MMRYTLLLIVGFSSALPLAAQDLFPKGSRPSDNPLRIEPKNMRKDDSEPSVSIVPKGKAESSGAPVIDMVLGEFSVETVADAEEAAPTNKVQDSILSFLMSTGVEYADEGEFEEAEVAYLRALKVDPENVDIRFRLGTLYVSMKRFVDAIEVFENLIEEFPENPLVHNNLSWCYATGPGVKNMTKALRHGREAILSAPFNSSMWNTLAEAYYVAGDYKKALRSSEHALDLLSRTNPSEEEARSFLAQRAKIMRAEEALKMLEGRDDEDD